MENILNREQILDWYMDDILDDIKISNVYQFCKLHGISEAEFYDYFANLNDIESYFFELLMTKTIETLTQAEEYNLYTPQEKLLSFYYTFFGNLTAHRSFTLTIFKNRDLNYFKKFTALRSVFIDFYKTLDFDQLNLKNNDLNRLQDKAYQETAYLQLLATLMYWKNDHSTRFEKTDIFIEKSLNAGFELMNINAVSKVADFAKFLLKEIKPKTNENPR